MEVDSRPQCHVPELAKVSMLFLDFLLTSDHRNRNNFPILLNADEEY